MSSNLTSFLSVLTTLQLLFDKYKLSICFFQNLGLFHNHERNPELQKQHEISDDYGDYDDDDDNDSMPNE
jgi:hypothetical protein